MDTLTSMMPKPNYNTYPHPLPLVISSPKHSPNGNDNIPPRIQSNTKLVNKMVLKSRNISCDHA